MSYNPRILETHVSVLMLLDDRAYKLKKAVKYPFIDLSTPERRAEACQREVELNRRLAPDVYLGVATVQDANGEVCDHVVVMRRMPVGRRLAKLVADRVATRDDMVAVARILASFHARAETSPAIESAGGRDGLRAHWEAGFDEIRAFVPDILDPEMEREIELLVRTYLEGRKPLFDSRVELGRVVDGHGDLLADDIFMLPDGPRVLDCLEFDDDLRYGDVLADVAFLAMDLERLGAPQLAASFLAAYREMAGETHPTSLEHHYIAYRAHIRAKVACLRGDRASADEARSLLVLALTHLRKSRVTLVLIGGSPGSGKSTLAAGIAARTGWSLLRSDEIRKDLAGLGHTASAPAALGEGIYTAPATDETYTMLLTRARTMLEHGESVVLDATWANAEHRDRASALALATTSHLSEIRCDAPGGVRAARVAASRP